MITPDSSQGQLYPNQNPLATQFMTGGQMEYMPDAQFLTSSEYGAFRTTPSFAQNTRQYQNPSLWQSHLQANRGHLPGINSDYFVNNYLPQVNQIKHQAMAQRRVSDAGSAFGGTVADMGLGMGVGSLAGGPIAGMAVSMLMPSGNAPYIDRIRNSRDVQQQSMSKIMSGRDMSKGLGQGFSLSASAGIEENIRKTAVSDKLFKEEDIRKLQTLGMQAGLFDFVGDGDQYKYKLEKLTKNHRAMMSLLETTNSKEVFDDLKRLQRMGMTSDQSVAVAGAEHTFGRMAGLNHQQMISNYGQQGAMTFSQHGFSGYQGSLSSMAEAGMVNMRKQLGLVNEAEVSRRGGVSGMVQNNTENTARGMQAIANVVLPHLASTNEDGSLNFEDIDTNRADAFMSGDSNIMETLVDTGERMRSGADTLLAYQGNKDEMMRKLYDHLGPVGYKLAERQAAMQFGESIGFDTEQEQMQAGYHQLFKQSSEDARLSAEQWSDKSFVNSLQEQMEVGKRVRQTQGYTSRQQDRTLGNRIGTMMGEASYEMFGSAYGSYTADAALEKDRTEQEKLGIASTEVYGLGLGEAGYTEYEKKRLRNTRGIGESMQGQEEDHYKNMRGRFSDLGLNDADVDSKYRNTDAVLEATELTQDDIAEVDTFLESSSVSRSDLRNIGGDIDGMGDLTDDNLQNSMMRTLVANNPGMTYGAAETEAARVMKNSAVRKTIFNTVATDDPERLQEMRDTMSEKHHAITGKQVGYLNDQLENTHAQMGEMVDQSIFGANNTEDLGTLKKATQHSGKSLHAFEAAAILSSLKDDKLNEDSDEYKQRAAQLRKQIRKIGGTEEDYERALADGGNSDSTATLQKILTNTEDGGIGMSKTFAGELLTAGGRAGEGNDSDDFIRRGFRMDTIEKSLGQVAQKSKSVNLYNMFRKDFAKQGEDVAEGLFDVETLDKVSEGTNNAELKAIIDKVRDGVGDGSISSQQDFMTAAGDSLSSYVDASKVDGMTDPANGNDDAVIGALGKISSDLTPVLNKVAAVVMESAIVMSRVNETLSKRQRAGL